MRFQVTTVAAAALCVASTVSGSPVDQLDLQFSGEDEVHFFQGDIATSYSQVSRLFGEQTAMAALADDALEIDDSEDTIDERRRLGTPAPLDMVFWNGAVVPFEIDASFGYDEAELANVTLAMQTIAEATGVTFIERTPAMNETHPSWVKVINATGCASYIGQVNYADEIEGKVGAQELFLAGPTATRKGTCRRTGTIMHEFLHALGLWHQQGMKNRDKRLVIYEEKIREDRFYNWDKQANSTDFFATEDDPEGTAVYSYGSIMHYPKTAFAITRGDTVMEAIDTLDNGTFVVNKNNTDSMGQRLRLDPTDAIEIQIMYHCHIENPTAGLEANFPVSNIRDLCSDRCQCAAQQGGCKKSSHCKGDLYCAANVGVYEHRGQRIELAGLNACLDESFLAQFPAVDGSAVDQEEPKEESSLTFIIIGASVGAAAFVAVVVLTLRGGSKRNDGHVDAVVPAPHKDGPIVGHSSTNPAFDL